VYDQHLRTQLAEERAANLRHDWPISDPEHRFRQAVAVALIRAGKKLAPEPGHPRPELSPRA
jgi:hypothetical protein